MTTLAVALKLATPPVMGGVSGGGGGLLLDAYTVGFAYSPRKLLTAYAGNCLRLRGTDAVEQDFGFVSNFLDIVSVNVFIAAHGLAATGVTYYDQSAVTDVTQGTTASQPTYVASGINGKPSFQFDGVNDRFVKGTMTPDAICNLNEMSWFAVLQQDSTQADNMIFQYRSGTSNLIDAALSATGDILAFDFKDSSGNRISGAQPSGWDNTPHVVDGYRSIADIQELFVDGVSLVSATRTADITNSSGAFGIGGGSNVSIFHKGLLGEIFSIKNFIGTSAHAALRANLQAFWMPVVVTGAAYFPPRYFPSRYFPRRYFG